MRRIAVVWAMILASAAVPAGAAIVLDDFENGVSPVAGMSADLVGTRLCDHLVGEGRALCGADTRKWSGPEGAVWSYALDFGRTRTVLFDVAAQSDKDPFDTPRARNGEDIWGDYLRVRAVFGAVEHLLAEFTRGPGDLRFNMVSTAAGEVLGAGVLAGQRFSTVALDVFERFNGQGLLQFELHTTSWHEQAGVDNIRVVPAPLPASVLMMALALGGLGAARRLRRG